MASKLRLCDGRELTIELGGKRTAEVLEKAQKDSKPFVQFNTPLKVKVWVSPGQVVAIEDRPDLDVDVDVDLDVD